MVLLKLLIGIVISLALTCFYVDANVNEDVSKFLKGVNQRLDELRDEVTLAEWEKVKSGSLDRSKANAGRKKLEDYLYSIVEDITKYKKLAKGNTALQRQLRYIPVSYQVLPREEYEVITTLAINATEVYQTISLCSYKDRNLCNLNFIKDIINVLYYSDDIKEIEFYWMQWLHKITAVIKGSYLRFVELYRKVAKLSGFSNVANFWYREVGEEGSAVSRNLDKVFKQSRPLYKQVHAYIRKQMRSKYGPKLIEYNKPVPDYLWMPYVTNISLSTDRAEVLPFNTIQSPNITDILLKQGLTPKDVYERARIFFTSLGMPPLEDSFWEDSCMQKKHLNDYEVTPVDWIFYNPRSVKVTYSPVVSELTFFPWFEVLSNVHYKRAFANHDILYQKPAILDIDKSLAKFFHLAASSPKYLESIGINYPDYKTKEARINRLYLAGLESIYEIYVYYIFERTRVGFLDGSLDFNDNCAYVNLVESVQGIQPPVARSKSDFDAARNLMVQYDSQHATSIYAVIVKYQLFEHFCRLTGEYDSTDPAKPLDLCDLTGHPEVGEQIYKAMSLGASVGAKDFLKVLTNSEELDTFGFMEYFKPLLEWLEEENLQNNNEVGWESANKCH